MARNPILGVNVNGRTTFQVTTFHVPNVFGAAPAWRALFLWVGIRSVPDDALVVATESWRSAAPPSGIPYEIPWGMGDPPGGSSWCILLGGPHGGSPWGTHTGIRWGGVPWGIPWGDPWGGFPWGDPLGGPLGGPPGGPPGRSSWGIPLRPPPGGIPLGGSPWGIPPRDPSGGAPARSGLIRSWGKRGETPLITVRGRPFKNELLQVGRHSAG